MIDMGCKRARPDPGGGIRAMQNNRREVAI